MTDVDPPYRKPATTPAELAQKLDWVPEEERELLRNTEAEFYNESMEVSEGVSSRSPHDFLASWRMRRWDLRARSLPPRQPRSWPAAFRPYRQPPNPRPSLLSLPRTCAFPRLAGAC